MTDLSNVTIDGERQTWQQLYERERVKVLDLEGYRIMLADLDRNEHGRHEGDGDVYDPSGMSQGNPHLATGQVIGYSIHGSWKYVVPEPRLRGDLAAWRVRTNSSQPYPDSTPNYPSSSNRKTSNWSASTSK